MPGGTTVTEVACAREPRGSGALAARKRIRGVRRCARTSVLLSPFLILGLVGLSVLREDCGRGGCGYQPTIQYTDGKGRAQQFTAPETSIDPAVGSAVRVSYDLWSPDDAHDLSISPSYWGYTTGTILITSCAVLVLGTTVTAVLIARSQRRQLPLGLR